MEGEHSDLGPRTHHEVVAVARDLVLLVLAVDRDDAPRLLERLVGSQQVAPDGDSVAAVGTGGVVSVFEGGREGEGAALTGTRVQRLAQSTSHR